MPWDLVTVAEALAGVLEATDAAKTFVTAPETFNAPAFVVEYPDLVDAGAASIGADVASIPVLVAVGQTEPQRLGELLTIARKAIAADPTLGRVALVARTNEIRNFRILTVGGAGLLTCQLIVEITV